MERIQKIQSALLVPKDQQGQNYKYRTLPSELQALLPLLAKHELTMTLPVDFQPSNGVNYVIAHCIIFDAKTGAKIAETTYPTMDSNPMIKGGQGTGAACTYAKKGAIDSMFLLDANDPNSPDLDAIGNGKQCPPGWKELTAADIAKSSWLEWGARVLKNNLELSEFLNEKKVYVPDSLFASFKNNIIDYMVEHNLK